MCGVASRAILKSRLVNLKEQVVITCFPVRYGNVHHLHTHDLLNLYSLNSPFTSPTEA